MDLKYEKKDVFSALDKNELLKVDAYAKDYMAFLNTAKTERLCVKEALKMLQAEGFVEIESKSQIVPGDKIYFINKNKSLFVAVIGNDALAQGVNIIGAHIDSPRIDLKPMPLYETHNMALLKSQYYGGIKKYQWLSIPLAMYGVVFNEKGERIEIAIGDEKDDPCFTITDLLPHLAKDQMKLTANEFIDPEKMNILVGNIKEADEKTNPVKANILKILNQKYGMKEIDFARSEIEFVPAFCAKYIGLDYSMIGGYGQDDRVCSYATLRAMLDLLKEGKTFKRTAIAMIVDKEEIGSVGNSSMSTRAFDMFMNMLVKKAGEVETDPLAVYYHSRMLSADVTAAVNPNYEEVHDIQNASIMGSGVSVDKYGGSGGKSGSSDANAEFMATVMNIFDRNHVAYQMGTLGKIGKGGGGTIAYILADKGVEVVDCGTAVLAMHSPYEVTSKFDVYMTYRAYQAFFQD